VSDNLPASNKLTRRGRRAQFFDPSNTRKADGQVDYDGILAKATAIRAKYANNPLLRADYIKVFADGVLAGSPYATPPTLPNGASLRPFKQPNFAVGTVGKA